MYMGDVHELDPAEAFRLALAAEMAAGREHVKDAIRWLSVPMWPTEEQRAAAMAMEVTDEQVDAYLAIPPDDTDG